MCGVSVGINLMETSSDTTLTPRYTIAQGSMLPTYSSL